MGISVLPQLDFQTYTSQMFWVAICLVVLYVFLGRVYVPRTRIMLEKRASYIKKNCAEAEAAEGLSAHLRHEQDVRLERMKLEAAKIIEQGVAEARLHEENSQHKASEHIANAIKRAEARMVRIANEQKEEMINWSALAVRDLYRRIAGDDLKVAQDELLELIGQVFGELENGDNS